MNDPSEFDCQDKSAHISSFNKTPAAIVQEYATKNKMIAEYELIYNDTSLTMVSFKYRLTLGEYEVKGVGLSKKEAKHEAAKNMLNKLIENNPILLKTAFKNVDFVNHMVSPYDNNIKINAVGKLNSACLNNKLGTPEFNLVREEGQSHAKLFTISCQVAKLIEYATHKTKKQAKHLVAVKMMNRLMNIDQSLVSEVVPNECKKASENVKPDVVSNTNNIPLEELILNYHLLFKKKKWLNTDTLDSVVEQYRKDGKLNISDPEDVLNKIVQECEMKLTVHENFMDMYILKIENVYPPVFGKGKDPDSKTARMLAIKDMLESICILHF